jgi:hypothetical protein
VLCGFSSCCITVTLQHHDSNPQLTLQQPFHARRAARKDEGPTVQRGARPWVAGFAACWDGAGWGRSRLALGAAVAAAMIMVWVPKPGWA